MRGVGESVGSAVFGTLGRVMARTQEKRGLPVDLLESDDAYLAIFDAPGALSSNIQVRFEDRTIHVRVDRFRSNEDVYTMTYPGRGLALDGKVELPDDATVDPAGGTATLKDNGTLHVLIPKTAGEDADDESTIETRTTDASEDDSSADAE